MHRSCDKMISSHWRTFAKGNALFVVELDGSGRQGGRSPREGDLTWRRSARAEKSGPKSTTLPRRIAGATEARGPGREGE